MKNKITIAEEKNANELKLVQIKAKFIEIGVLKMPTKEILKHRPKKLNNDQYEKWRIIAGNVWNGRSGQYKIFLPIFEQVYEQLKDTENISLLKEIIKELEQEIQNENNRIQMCDYVIPSMYDELHKMQEKLEGFKQQLKDTEKR